MFLYNCQPYGTCIVRVLSWLSTDPSRYVCLRHID